MAMDKRSDIFPSSFFPYTGETLYFLDIFYIFIRLPWVREIRMSERKFYQKITDIYATALDYDQTAQTTTGVSRQSHSYLDNSM
jgi:hypothetical protein